MQAKPIAILAMMTAMAQALTGCEEKTKPTSSEKESAKFALASAKPGSQKADPAKASPAAAEPPPSGCKATGSTPVKLGTTVGDVYGFAGDATHLYYSTWQLYGSRGDLGRVRKDAGGTENLVSLGYEPRDIVVEENTVFYTEGIRLMKIAKAEGKPVVVAPQFSSLSIDINASQVFGVPGEYGPYDRLVKVDKTGGVNTELDVSTRPETKTGPVGFSALAIDGTSVWVTDTGAGRLLRFGLERAKPKIVATGQPKAYDLAIDSGNVYFTLADKGLLMSIPKLGGAAKKLASGLVPKSRIAADEAGILAVFGRDDGKEPLEIAKVSRDNGERIRLATVAASYVVQAVALDKDCAYWVAHPPGSGPAEFYAVAR